MTKLVIAQECGQRWYRLSSWKTKHFFRRVYRGFAIGPIMVFLRTPIEKPLVPSFSGVDSWILANPSASGLFTPNEVRSILGYPPHHRHFYRIDTRRCTNSELWFYCDAVGCPVTLIRVVLREEFWASTPRPFDDVYDHAAQDDFNNFRH